MKCPLFVMSCLNLNGSFDGRGADCLKEECAWWMRVDERKFYREGCAIIFIAEELAGVKDKISYAGEGK